MQQLGRKWKEEWQLENYTPNSGNRGSLVWWYGGCLRASTAHHNGDERSSLLATAKGEVAPSLAAASGGVEYLENTAETASG